MTALVVTPFSFENHQIRTVSINGNPWFIASDVCLALKISNVSDALYKLDDDERLYLGLTEAQKIDKMAREINIISESGMYTLVLRCRDAVKQGTLPHRFRKWVTNEVLPSIRKTGKYEDPKPRPEAPELLSDNDTRNLAHLVWSMANGFRFEKAWTQGIWYALRHATGVASPKHFGVNQIAIIAEECRRIYGITSKLKSAIFDAEKQAICRLLRHKEDVETVLREMQQLLEASTHEYDSVMIQSLEKWQQASVNRFLQRN